MMQTNQQWQARREAAVTPGVGNSLQVYIAPAPPRHSAQLPAVGGLRAAHNRFRLGHCGVKYRP